jgi:hypothetical protein
MFAIGMTLLFLVLVAVTPAQAAFTTAEAAQIEHIRLNVVGRLGSAFQAYQVALAQNQDTLVMRQRAVLHTNYATDRVMRGLSKLVDVVSHFNFQEPSQATRAGRVAAAWDDFDEAVALIDQAIAALSGATGLHMKAARDTWLPAAKSAIRTTNRTLGYTDARPKDYPMIIGPHGDYDFTQAYLARAWAYNLDIVTAAFTRYGLVTLNWPVLVQASYLNYLVYADGLALMAGVGQTGLGQFWRVLNYSRRLTDPDVGSAASRYHALLAALTVTADPQLRGTIGRVGESWKFMDAAVWNLLVFPNCNQSSDPQGCAASQVGP